MTAVFWYLDDIRDAVNAPQTADPDMLREASIAYNEACREANRRLRDVQRLLRTGLRSEAIQVSEEEPPLLDFVAELDLALIEDWQGMLAQWGMELPPELEVGIAAELNAAYAELLPLEQLLRHHRLLALARAPLSARLQVLRQIAQKDELNASWKTEIVSYEQLRIREIKQGLREAAQNGDLETLQGLRVEVRESPWIVDLPAEIIVDIDKAFQRQRQADARRNLENLVAPLDRAYSEFDTQRAVLLAQQWQQHATTAGLTEDDPLQQSAQEALDWVSQEQARLGDEQAFATCLASLEKALDGHASHDVLESQLQKAERFQLPIPELLQRRVEERLETLQFQSRRKGLMIGGLATLLVLVASLSAFYFWRSSQYRSELNGYVAHLQTLVEQEQWAQARQYVDRLPERIASHADIIALHTQSTDGMEVEKGRAEAVSELLKRGEEMDPAAPDGTLLSQLRQLVKLPEEERRLAVIELKVRQKRQERQSLIDEGFLVTVNSWSTKIEELEDGIAPDTRVLRRMLVQLQSELNQHQGVSAGLRRQGEPLTSKLRAIIDQQENLNAELQARQALFRAVGRPGRYLSALQRLIDTHPDTVAASHARQIVDEQKLWRSTIDWVQFWQDQQSWKSLSPTQAKQVIAAGDELVSETTPNELSRAFEARKEFLSRVVARDDVDLNQLKAFLIQNKLISGVWLVIDEKNRRYYCPRKPMKSDPFLQWEYFRDYSTTKDISLQESSITYLGEAPQTKAAARLADLISKLTNNNWDETFGNMASEVRKRVADDVPNGKPGIDPVLAMDMLRRILKTGGEGSFQFDKAFAPLVSELQDSGVDLSVYWFVPDDTDAGAARNDARAMIAGLDDFRTKYAAARRLVGEYCEPPAERISWVGALDQNRSGKWALEPPPASDADGILLIASAAQNDEIELAPVGRIEDGSVAWSNAFRSDRRLIGTPLFLRSTAPETEIR